MRRNRRYLTFPAGCPGCGYLNLCRLVEAIFPPMRTQAEYDCASCGKRNVTVIPAIFYGTLGWTATLRWERSPIVPATVHDPDRLRRWLTASR